MDDTGYIYQIYYDSKDANSYAVELKKRILGLLSNKLMISEMAEDENARWAYTSEEEGQDGRDYNPFYFILLISFKFDSYYST